MQKRHRLNSVVQNNLLSKVTLIIGVLATCLLSTHVTQAQTAYTGIDSIALGGTGRAAVRQEEVGFLNPAALVHTRGFAITGGYRKMDIPGDGKIENMALHLSESGTNSLFPLGVTYLKTRNFYLPFVNYEENLHLSTAAMVLPNFSIGLDVSRNQLETDNMGYEDWNASLGLLYVINGNIGLGFVYYNVLDSDIYYLARRMALGTSYLFQGFLKAFLDVEYQVDNNIDNDLIYMIGLEHSLHKMFDIRFGTKFDDFNNRNYWTAGFGFKGPRLGLSYAFEKNFAVSTELAHSFDLKLLF